MKFKFPFYFSSFLLLGAMLLGTSCAVTKEYEQDLTIIGRSCGMCQGTCFKGYQLMDGKVQVIEAESVNKLETATLTTISVEKEKKFRELLSLLPSLSWPDTERIGCPDCHDQCGIYVSVMKGKERKLVLIDPDQNAYPKSIEPFVALAKDLLWQE